MIVVNLIQSEGYFIYAVRRFRMASIRLLMIEALAVTIPKKIQHISVVWVLAFTLPSR